MVRINSDTGNQGIQPPDGPSGKDKGFKIDKKQAESTNSSKITAQLTDISPRTQAIINDLEKWYKDHENQPITEEDFEGYDLPGPPPLHVKGLDEIRKDLNSPWRDGVDQDKLKIMYQGIDSAYKSFNEGTDLKSVDADIKKAIYWACLNVDPKFSETHQ